MEYLHLNLEAKFSDYSKSCLIRGLTDPNEKIASNLMNFWSSKCKLSSEDPQERLQQLLTQFYDSSEEQSWLNNSCHLFLLASKNSKKFDH